MNRSRELIPEWAKPWFRLLRARVLSLGLGRRGPFSLGDEERQVSATMSVIVAVHDAPEVTSRCLRSLEVFGGGAEVIVVDDGSRLESTKQLLVGACSRNGWRLIRNDKPLGHSRASEAGVSVSARPYLCLLNSDAIVTSRSWLGIVRAFDSSPQIAVVGPSTSHTHGPQVVSRALHCRHYWSDEQIWCFAERYVLQHLSDSLVDLPAVGGFAFFVRRKAWEEMGGFDKQLPDYGNESEFCQRVRQAGRRIVWTKASYIHHLGSASYSQTFGWGGIRKRCIDATAYINAKWTR